MLQIEHLLDRRPDQLSGGQRQRVAIGRALVRDADGVPVRRALSNLDAQLRNELRVEIKRLHQRLGSTTMIYVTHDQIEALTLADRIAVMKDQRSSSSTAPAEIYHRPANRFVAGFVGSPRMNFLDGRLIDGPAFACGERRLPLDGYASRRGRNRGSRSPWACGRSISRAGDGWDGFTVDLVEPMGADNLVWCRDGDLTVELRLPGERNDDARRARGPGNGSHPNLTVRRRGGQRL